MYQQQPNFDSQQRFMNPNVEHIDAQFRPSYKRSFEEEADRLGFIRKVYGIIFTQLSVTSLVTYLTMTSESLQIFMAENPSIGLLCTLSMIVTELLLVCSKRISRQVPLNYCLLGFFTLCQSYSVATLAALYEPEGVTMAAVATAAATGGLSIYAMTTKSDFTRPRGFFSVLLTALFLTFVSLFMFNTEIEYVVSLAVSCLIFGSYIVYDTQLIMGHKTFEVNDDDYIIGALILYVDIVVLFAKILKAIAKDKKD